MSGANPVLQYSDGTTKPQAPGTTLAQIREGQGASCWLEDTTDSCEYRSPDFVLVSGHTYKVLKPDATATVSPDVDVLAKLQGEVDKLKQVKALIQMQQTFKRFSLRRKLGNSNAKVRPVRQARILHQNL